jgi:hypothetical protein
MTLRQVRLRTSGSKQHENHRCAGVPQFDATEDNDGKAKINAGPFRNAAPGGRKNRRRAQDRACRREGQDSDRGTRHLQIARDATADTDARRAFAKGARIRQVIVRRRHRARGAVKRMAGDAPPGTSFRGSPANPPYAAAGASGSSPYRFGPTVPRRQPSSTKAQIEIARLPSANTAPMPSRDRIADTQLSTIGTR